MNPRKSEGLNGMNDAVSKINLNEKKEEMKDGDNKKLSMMSSSQMFADKKVF